MSTKCKTRIDEPADGSWNMAIDEYLLANAEEIGPTLRFYRWSQPTLSLGYFQKYDDRQLHSASANCDCVRRHSGGGAILHDQEITYSLVMPTTDRWSRAAEQLYTLVHEALIRAYSHFGATCKLSEQVIKEPFLCFQRRSVGDILLDDHKVTGSAQRRHKGAILQHGSILISRSPKAPELAGLTELTGSRWSHSALIEACLHEMAIILKLDLKDQESANLPRENVKTIQESKFGSDKWTNRR